MVHMADDLKKYLKTWFLFSKISFNTAFQSRLSTLLFVLAKFLRFGFFLFFIFVLLSETKGIAGYSIWQVTLFYGSFSLIDSLSQFLLREVYRFRDYIIRGNFDFILVKPISPLFRSLFGGSDILDVPMIFISLVLIFLAISNLSNLTIFGIISYLILFTNALIIALSFHIFILAFGVISTDIENSIFIYRDLTNMGRFPIDIYIEPLRSLITFVIPVAIMTSFPVKALLGMLSPGLFIIAFVWSFGSLFLSIWFWKLSLKRYSSASS